MFHNVPAFYALKFKKISSQPQWLKGFWKCSLFMTCQTSEKDQKKEVYEDATRVK
jgi:hypothetical protein